MGKSKTIGSKGWLDRTISRRQAIKLGAAAGGAVVVSMYVKPAIQRVGPAKATAGTPTTMVYEGCSPGYWGHPETRQWPDNSLKSMKLPQIFASAAGTDVSERTMWEAVASPPFGGTLLNLMFHAVAGYLNALHPDLNYPLTTFGVVSKVNDALDAFKEGDNDPANSAASTLAVWNTQNCPW